MFERYTETARRVLYFARYEASQTGSDFIEPGHLLLGLMREDRHVASGALDAQDIEVDELRKQLTRPGAAKVSTSVDMPLSDKSKSILAHAAEESDQTNVKNIETVHLLMGIVREQDSVAAPFVKSRGITLAKLREQFGTL